MDNIIALKDISKVYGDKVKTQVIFDINLGIKKGSFTSIIGASGSGKSTLLNIIGNLDQPSSGEILINGKKTKDLKEKQLAKLRNETMGFIFQFHYLLPEYTALENILMPNWIKNGKITKKELERAKELMSFVGISKVQDNLAGNMSGGQQQRTAIARALINNPAILLADEPTGNLDSVSTDQVYDLLRKINQEFGTTFVVITHDRSIAERTDRIIEIKDGRIHLDMER